MNGSSHFTKRTLRTLTALAIDRKHIHLLIICVLIRGFSMALERNLRDMVDNGFVDILLTSLNNSDPLIAAQAIKTVLAIAEDGKHPA